MKILELYKMTHLPGVVFVTKLWANKRSSAEQWPPPFHEAAAKDTLEDFNCLTQDHSIDHIIFVMNTIQMQPRRLIKKMLTGIGCKDITGRKYNTMDSYLSLFHLDCSKSTKEKRVKAKTYKNMRPAYNTGYKGNGASTGLGHLNYYATPDCCGSRIYTDLTKEQEQWKDLAHVRKTPKDRTLRLQPPKAITLYVVPSVDVTKLLIDRAMLHPVVGGKDMKHQLFWSSYRDIETVKVDVVF